MKYLKTLHSYNYILVEGVRSEVRNQTNKSISGVISAMQKTNQGKNLQIKML